ncbi:TPA: sugar ABC transporter permease [Candidatus Spyradomonas excrementavium]|nr:sugar ABC transporter permease [Candidatus Spyradomonas excrementavium]
MAKKTADSDNFQYKLLILPALIGTLIFIVIPVVFSFGLSFCEWDLLSDVRFAGLKNYFELLTSPNFALILKNTFVFAISVTLIAVVIPVILAAVLNNKIRGSEFFKTAYFLPFITPMIVIAIIWEWIFDPNFGLLNYLLKTHINWLYDTKTALFALIIVSAWKLIGYNMVILLSGFSTISQNIYESAKIDGASPLNTFFKITLPLLSPTIFFVVIITTISSFQVFDLIYLMTQGGPMDSTNVLVYWIYKNAFEFFNIGAASAGAYILFVIVFVLTVIQWNIRKKWVFSE